MSCILETADGSYPKCPDNMNKRVADWCIQCRVERLEKLTLCTEPPDPMLLRQLDSVGVANINLRNALRKAVTWLQKYEQVCGVPLPELAELEAALNEVPQ